MLPSGRCYPKELPYVAHNEIYSVAKDRQFIVVISLRRRENLVHVVGRELLIYELGDGIHSTVPTVSIDSSSPGFLFEAAESDRIWNSNFLSGILQAGEFELSWSYHFVILLHDRTLRRKASMTALNCSGLCNGA